MGGTVVELPEMVVNTAQMNRRGNQVLMFNGRVKKAFDNFEVAAVRFVESVAEVNNAQKVHDIGHIFDGQRFG